MKDAIAAHFVTSRVRQKVHERLRAALFGLCGSRGRAQRRAMRACEHGSHARVGAINEIADRIRSKTRLFFALTFVNVERHEAPGAHDAFTRVRTHGWGAAHSGEQTERGRDLEQILSRDRMRLTHAVADYARLAGFLFRFRHGTPPTESQSSREPSSAGCRTKYPSACGARMVLNFIGF